ncbi:MAG: EamA family transporter, partial [Candidatus Thorarchaeota archaeon]
GSFLLLITGFSTSTLPLLSLQDIIIILWLGIINTALAFTLWNKSLQHLRAMDSSLINSLMLPQIVILSIIFLAESVTINEVFGLIVLICGILILQIQQAKKNGKKLSSIEIRGN